MDKIWREVSSQTALYEKPRFILLNPERNSMPIINKTVLMSDTKHFSNIHAINPYYHHESIDCLKVMQEHEEIKRLLIQAGVNVISVASPEHSQDGIYTANWAVVRGNKAVMSRLPDARKAEEPHAEKVLHDLGKEISHIPGGLKFSGQGDALPCGDYIFCGSGYRSDEASQKFVAKTLGFKRIQLQAIPERDTNNQIIINSETGWPDSFFYDIDLSLAIIKAPSDNQKGLIAYCPEAFMPESRELIKSLDFIDKIEVSINEAQQGFATNLVSTGETVIMSARAPQLASDLKNRGLNVVQPDITEISKGGGYIRCVTLTLD